MDRAPDETIEGRILCIVNVITLGGRPRVGRNAEPLGSCPTSCGRNHHAKCVQLTWSRCPEPACLGSMHWYSEEVLVGVSERMRSMLFDERHQRSHIKQRLCFDPIQISSGPKELDYPSIQRESGRHRLSEGREGTHIYYTVYPICTFSGNTKIGTVEVD